MIHNMRRPVAALLVSPGQREVLESMARSPSAPHREVVRARALLMAADGLANTAIARALSVSPASVSGWRTRFAEEGLVKFAQVRQGRGRKKTIPQQKIDEIVDLTLNYRPAGETHWSCRTMAAASGVSKSTVQQVWSARGLKPHRVETFKLSNDPNFEEKLVDVVGLYLNPPEKAIVLCAAVTRSSSACRVACCSESRAAKTRCPASVSAYSTSASRRVPSGVRLTVWRRRVASAGARSGLRLQGPLRGRPGWCGRLAVLRRGRIGSVRRLVEEALARLSLR